MRAAARTARDGVAAPNGNVRYVTLPAGNGTALAVISTHSGRVVRFTSLPGSWGIPSVTINGSNGGGLSRDGRTLVVGDASPQQVYPRRESTFLIIDTKTLQTRTFARLKGDFAYDAMSPDAKTLYLIQHVSTTDLSRYVVRAYDLDARALRQSAIADKAQRGWVMAGYPLTRVTSPDGRMVYTFYQRGGGYPFIHALDTVSATAHCLGVPWRGSRTGSGSSGCPCATAVGDSRSAGLAARRSSRSIRKRSGSHALQPQAPASRGGSSRSAQQRWRRWSGAVRLHGV